MTDSTTAEHPPTTETPAPPVDPRYQALVDVFGEQFAESFRDPVLHMPFSLRAPMPQAMLRRDFRLLSRACYLESVYRRRDGYNQDVLDAFARMAGEKIASITKLFDNRTTQLLKVYRDNGFEPDTVYHKQMDYPHLPIIAGHARSFIKLLERLDNYYQLTGCASMFGIFDGKQRSTAELEARKAVRSFTGMIRTEVSKLRKESQRVRAERFGAPADAEADRVESIAESMTTEAERELDASAHEDPASAVSQDQAAAVLDSLVASGVASSTAATRRKSTASATAPAPEASAAAPAAATAA